VPVADVLLRPFTPADQIAAKNLILTGLGEHFGFIDPTMNPDLNDIMTTYVKPGNIFIVAECAGELVGTGALIAETAVAGRIVRVSVSSTQRRQGIGRMITEHLVAAGRQLNYREILVETNDDWQDAINLYLHCGFHQFDHHSGDVHLRFSIDQL
jgi:GNAT superfamily N-acetyltransferase